MREKEAEREKERETSSSSKKLHHVGNSGGIRRGEDGGRRGEVELPVSAIAKLLSQDEEEQGERGEGKRGGEELY